MRFNLLSRNADSRVIVTRRAFGKGNAGHNTNEGTGVSCED